MRCEPLVHQSLFVAFAILTSGQAQAEQEEVACGQTKQAESYCKAPVRMQTLYFNTLEECQSYVPEQNCGEDPYSPLPPNALDETPFGHPMLTCASCSYTVPHPSDPLGPPQTEWVQCETERHDYVIGVTLEGDPQCTPPAPSCHEIDAGEGGYWALDTCRYEKLIEVLECAPNPPQCMSEPQEG